VKKKYTAEDIAQWLNLKIKGVHTEKFNEPSNIIDFQQKNKLKLNSINFAKT
jgi:hypothetical protein